MESTARDALAEMRRMLGLLRSLDDEQSSATAAPAPGLRHLDELVERATSGGGHLHLPEQLVLPAGLELAVYRIIQEALTNIDKHPPGAAVHVSIDEDDNHLTVEVNNGPGAAPHGDGSVGAGRGLLGARERAALYGGSLSAAPTAEGGFRLTARFPGPQGSQVSGERASDASATAPS